MKTYLNDRLFIAVLSAMVIFVLKIPKYNSSNHLWCKNLPNIVVNIYVWIEGENKPLHLSTFAQISVF